MVLDATVGGPAANSYLDVAAADLLNAERRGSFAATWAAADTPTKEKALIQATADIDANVSAVPAWDADQLLLFPREIDVDDDDLPYLPARVKLATYEQAIYLVANITLLEDAARRRARGMFSFDEEGGPSGSIVLDGRVGLLAPRAEQLLGSIVATSGSAGYVGSIRVKSAMVHAAERGS